MFHPARPPERWSSPANRRATSKGCPYVVDAVAMSPIRSVEAASAASSVSGSIRLAPDRLRTSPMSASASARKTESNFAASAIRVTRWWCARLTTASGSDSGSRHAASWWPASCRNRFRCS